VALAGAGVFIVFDRKSQAIYDELRDACGNVGCGPERRPRADEGKRDQTIANVGLAIGVVAGVATIAFLLVRAYGPRSAKLVVPAGGALSVDL
jgi:hypothetical protein